MTPRGSEPPDFPASQLFLRRLAYSLVHDSARAEDLVQDTWAAWAEHRPSGLAEPRAWLARVLRNRAFNARRDEERRARREQLAARPDPSEPETEGTLEAQARLIEALRRLDEPYRSTLVQRYYHDLAPAAIAERSGTPLNTVKARLARGLEKLRAELDRRYGGDRGAWCHWLAMIGRQATPVPVPAGSAGAGASLGSGKLVAALLWASVAGLLALVTWRERGGGQDEVTREPEPERSREPPVVGKRVPLETASDDEAHRQSVAQTGAELTTPVPVASRDLTTDWPVVVPRVRESFEWPQYGGGSAHDNFRDREDQIRVPRVLWFVPGCAGQPTLSGGDLYSGGIALFRIDPLTGELKGTSLALTLGRLREAAERGDVDGALRIGQELEEEFGKLEHLEELGDLDLEDTTAWGAAPAILRDRVLVRRRRDGAVVAFDRFLGRELWTWVAEQWSSDRTPGCLVDDQLFIVPLGEEVIALHVVDGSEAWRFDVDSEDRLRRSYVRLTMVPAAEGKRVFIGTNDGRVFALDLMSGRELWSTSVGGVLQFTAPVVVRDHVLLHVRHFERQWMESGGIRPDEFPSRDESEGSAFLALEARSGREAWRTRFGWNEASMPGVGPRSRYVLWGYGDEVARFDLSSGKVDQRHRLRTELNPLVSPTVVGESLVFGSLDGHLYVHDLESGELRWAFHAPAGAQIDDFVHAGTHVFVATSTGLFCIGAGETQAAAEPGLVLEWSGDTSEAWSLYGKEE